MHAKSGYGKGAQQTGLRARTRSIADTEAANELGGEVTCAPYSDDSEPSSARATSLGNANNATYLRNYGLKGFIA